MTVIAYRDGVIACDSRINFGGFHASTKKWEKVGDHLLFGAGDASQFLQLVEWYRNGAVISEWPAIINRENYCRLIVCKDGKVFEYEYLPYPIEVIDDYAAWGSGFEVALGAMYAGMGAGQAAKAACALVSTCGGEVHVFEVPSSGSA
jgi:hypothetical protein